MKDKLTIAEVDCEAYGSLCRSQDIQGYPMLFLYNTDGSKVEYTGSRKLEPLNGFVGRVIAPYVKAHVQTIFAELW
jgi:Thioredoxin